MRWRWWLPLFSIALGATSSARAKPPPGSIGVIDRVIAVVGFECILLSELRSRARPFVARVPGPESAPAHLSAEAQILREMLERMVDERLIAAEAQRAQILVTPAEIDAAMLSVATNQGMSVKELLVAAKARGLGEKDYRDELRRQVLEGKILQLRVAPRIKDYAKLSEAQRAKRLDEERAKYLEELRAATFLEVRL